MNWIKISDQFPPVGENILISNKEDILLGEVYEEKCPYRIKIFGKYTIEDGSDGEGLLKNYTHWMPLPQPPQ